MKNQRLDTLRGLMQKQGVDAVALVPSANMLYLTGVSMHLSERVTLALITQDAVHLIVPALEVPRVESRAVIPITLHPWSDAQWVKAGWDSLKQAVQLDGKNVAADYHSVRVLEFTQLKEFAPSLKLTDAGPMFTELRISKDAAEVDAMRRAAQVLDASVEALIPELRVGKTEREIAARWQWLMFEHGSDGIPDAPIVASGPNTALPHTTYTERALERGDLLTLDGWCAVDGYYGDTTRTFAIGELSDELRHVYETVQAANAAGRAASKPNSHCQDVDRAARGVIREAGLGDFFLHRTGHGLGLEVHEAPNMVEGDTRTLIPGITFTVEPGVYLAGKGGVRIEDDMVITANGSESLTTFARELRIL